MYGHLVQRDSPEKGPNNGQDFMLRRRLLDATVDPLVSRPAGDATV
jgi:hypothetical protein